jgi:phosphatidylglycerophosphate synthase
MATKPLQRTNTGWLAPLERPALANLAVHLPAWVTPDHLTILGFIGTLVMLAGYALAATDPAWLWLASFGLVVNWYGDSLDGTVARYRKIERPNYGYFVDNSVDLITQFLIAVGMGVSGYIRWELSFLVLSVFLMMSVLTLLREKISGVFQLAYGGIGPTEMRVLFILLNTAMFFFPPQSISLFGLQMTYPNWLSLIWIAFALATFGWTMSAQIRELAIQEPPRRR